MTSKVIPELFTFRVPARPEISHPTCKRADSNEAHLLECCSWIFSLETFDSTTSLWRFQFEASKSAVEFFYKILWTIRCVCHITLITTVCKHLFKSVIFKLSALVVAVLMLWLVTFFIFFFWFGHVLIHSWRIVIVNITN